MTTNLPPKPRRFTPPPSSPVSNNPAETGEPKPYELTSFPKERPPKNPPAGHHQ